MGISSIRTWLVALTCSVGVAFCVLIAGCNSFVLYNQSSGPMSIESISPTFALLGSNSETVAIHGSGFNPFTLVTFNGGVQKVTFISPQLLTIYLGQSELSSVGTFPIAVSNGSTSDNPAPATFSVWNLLSSTTPNPIGYPPNWSYSVTFPTNGQPEQIGFVPQGKQIDLDSEYAGDIVETFLSNPTNTLDQYYNTVAPVNLLVNSASAVHYQINGSPAIKFTSVFGMIPTDIIAVQRGQNVIEISDVGQQHQTDGLLDNFAAAIP
jgi:hypothetical protein